MKKLIISVAASLFVYGVLGSAVWAGPSIKDSVVAYGFEGLEGETCVSSDFGVISSEPQEMEAHGNKLHFLAPHNEALMVSDDDRISGLAIVIAEAFVNIKSGHVTVHGHLVLQPSAYPDGAWEGDFNMHIPGGRSMDVDGIIITKDSQMNLRGTGVFDGQWFFFSHGMADTDVDLPVDDPDGDGGCDFTGEIFAGTILNPNAN
jgi:hypothetical protein